MNSSNIKIFSPTGNTMRIANTIMSNLSDMNIGKMEDIFIIGCPIYKGRVPQPYMQWLERHPFSNKKVILVETFGNAHIDDALLELHDWAITHKNKVVGAVAITSSHSYSTKKHPIATDHPTLSEWKELDSFIENIAQKICNNQFPSLYIPGNSPYKNIPTSTPTQPLRDAERCCSCGQCQEICPQQNADILGLEGIVIDQCLMCCACIQHCPTDAISYKETSFYAKIEMLREVCKTPKQSLFIY